MKNAQISVRERQRRAQDLILVYNPTTEDFKQPFDRVVFVIPHKDSDQYGYGTGYNAVPRYVAELYVRHMTNKIMGDNLLEAIKEENEKRRKNGMKEMDKYMGGEEDHFAKQYGVGDERKREEIFPMLWKGVYKQYGAGDLMLQQEEEKPRDSRSFEERMAEMYDFPAQTPQELPQNPPQGSGTPEPSVATEKVEELEEKKNEAIAEVI